MNNIYLLNRKFLTFVKSAVLQQLRASLEHWATVNIDTNFRIKVFVTKNPKYKNVLNNVMYVPPYLGSLNRQKKAYIVNNMKKLSI